MRRSVFGIGGSQVAISGLLLAGACLYAGLPLATSLVTGLALALSSTAFGLQILAEKKQERGLLDQIEERLLTEVHISTPFA